MMNGKFKYLVIPILILDILLLFISFEIVKRVFSFDFILGNHLLLFGELILLWIGLSLNLKIHDIPRFIYIDKIIVKSISAMSIYFGISTCIVYFQFEGDLSKNHYIISMFLFGLLFLGWQIILIKIVKELRVRGHNNRELILVGLNEKMVSLIQRILSNPDIGYRINGIFSNSKSQRFRSYRKGNLEDVLDYCKVNTIHDIIISLPHQNNSLIDELLHFGNNNMINTQLIPNFSGYLYKSFYIDYLDSVPILSLRDDPFDSISNKIVKRVFDILFSLSVIILIFPWLFFVIAIMIKLTSKGPVFFKQERNGRWNKPFKCYKFRSMYENNVSDSVQAVKNDPRLTKIGKFLRRTSIDELPQFINVLRGDMSIVGPRPHMLKHTEQYKDLVNMFMIRQHAYPGITGWAQIKGFRGEIREIENMEDRAEADIWYIENWSPVLDVKIIFLTVWRLFFQKNENAY